MLEAKKFDLHCHSYYSDGVLSPKELLLRAHNMQVDVLALTDHDTVAGVQELIDEQRQHKRKLDIVVGVELSTSWHGFDIHIVGLNVDHKAPEFLENLKSQAESRELRARKIADKLDKAGASDAYEQVKTIAGKGQVTRAHFAQLLVKQQLVDCPAQAFKKFLGKGKRAHVKPEWISIEQAIEWIHNAGGQAILAHPGHYDMSSKWLRRLVAEFSDYNGDGIEANHPHLAPNKRQFLEALTVEYQLLASTGSDFHFPGRWTELGRNLKINDRLTPVWHNWQHIAA